MDICDKLRQAISLTLGDEQPDWLEPEQGYFDMLKEALSEIDRLRLTSGGLPKPAPDMILVAGRYHDIELGFALSQENMRNEDAISRSSIRLCECLVKIHNGEMDAGPFNLETKDVASV